MIEMNIERLEVELKKRWAYPYKWGRKQSNNWDASTNFIYQTRSFKDLITKISTFNQPLKDYAMNRWYNYWSAMGVEFLFANHKSVIPNTNIYDKLVDFSINNIPFDHKTSVFPKGFNNTFKYATNHKKELIKWLYENQSQQARKHLKNRLFVILYDHSGHHWKMKAEMDLLKNVIDSFVNSFSSTNLISINIDGNDILSDIIWLEKNIK